MTTKCDSWAVFRAANGISFSTPSETLAYGAKTLGWEINEGPANYSGPFQNARCFEKAGGAGTFLWVDQETGASLVYLTNHGKPKPFTAAAWDRLVQELDPQGLSRLFA
jgi:CubicO group peptidase (beta-lactamase class C family)